MRRPVRFLSALLMSVCVCASCGSWPVPADLDAFVRENRGLASSSWTELWVLERDPVAARERGFGVLRVGGDALEPRRVAVDATVLGRLGSVRVRHSFMNEGTGPAEIDYELAVPRAAAVTDMVVQIGSRRIRAVVRERGEASRLYSAARSQGLTASLVAPTDGVYRHRLGVVEAGQAIDVDVAYVQAVPWSGGWCTLELPALEVDEALLEATVDLESGVPFEEAEGFGGSWKVERGGADRASWSLVSRGRTTERCGVRWRVAPATTRHALFVWRDAAGGDPYFMLTAYAVKDAFEWGGLEPYATLPLAGANGERAPAFVVVGRLPAVPDALPPAWEVRRAERLGRALPQAWARLEVERLVAALLETGEPAREREILASIRSTALAHGIASGVTSVLMVDAGAGSR